MLNCLCVTEALPSALCPLCFPESSPFSVSSSLWAEGHQALHNPDLFPQVLSDLVLHTILDHVAQLLLGWLLFSLFYQEWQTRSCVGWVSPEADPDTKIWVKVLYLGGDSWKHLWRTGEVRQTRKASNGDCHGQLRLNLLVDSRRGCRAHLRIFPSEGRGCQGYLSSHSHLSEGFTSQHTQPPPCADQENVPRQRLQVLATGCTGIQSSMGLSRQAHGALYSYICSPGTPSLDHDRITQFSQPSFLLSPNKNSESFSKAVLQAATSHWLELVHKIEPMLYPFYLVWYLTLKDFCSIVQWPLMSPSVITFYGYMTLYVYECVFGCISFLRSFSLNCRVN